jgi:hypothetical protein
MSILYSITPLGDEIFSLKSDYTCGPWEDLGVNYWPLSICHHKLTHRPKESMKLPFTYC